MGLRQLFFILTACGKRALDWQVVFMSTELKDFDGEVGAVKDDAIAFHEMTE